MIRTESLMKMRGVIALLATTLAISDSASAINLTIENTSRNMIITTGGASPIIGQSFINDTSGTGASILLNDWTFAISEYYPYISTVKPLFSLTTLNIYSGTGNSGTLIGSATAYDSSITLSEVNAAKWTFAGGLSLIDNQTYTAALISDGYLMPQLWGGSNGYPNGYFTHNLYFNDPSVDTVFRANFSPAATPVPFEFEPTGGLLVLGGGWLFRRHLKKIVKKD